MLRQSLAILVSVGLSAVVAPAWAQAPSARDLAQQGKTQVEAGNDAAGCPMLEQAWSMDNELLGAGFTLAECHERAGKLASAHRQFLVIATKAKARGEERAVLAQSRADALAPRLSTLKVVAPPEVASAPGLQVTVGSTTLSQAELNSELRLDGGKQDVVVKATGRKPWTQNVDVPKEGGRLEITLELGATASGDEPDNPPPGKDPQADTSSDGLSPIRIGGITATVVGGVAAVLGVTFGVLAIQRLDESNQPGVCEEGTNRCATPEGVDLRSESLLYGDISTAMVVIGGVGVATGIILLAIPIEDSANVKAGIGPGAIRLSGTF